MNNTSLVTGFKMARSEKKLSVHFEDSIGLNNLSISDPNSVDVEDQVQLKEAPSTKRKLSYRMSQVVMRRKKSRIGETAIIVIAIVTTIVFILGIVSYLVFSENSHIQKSRVPTSGRQ